MISNIIKLTKTAQNIDDIHRLINFEMLSYHEILDKTNEIYIWDGGLPKDPKPPWNYSLFFNIYSFFMLCFF